MRSIHKNSLVGRVLKQARLDYSSLEEYLNSDAVLNAIDSYKDLMWVWIKENMPVRKYTTCWEETPGKISWVNGTIRMDIIRGQDGAIDRAFKRLAGKGRGGGVRLNLLPSKGIKVRDDFIMEEMYAAMKEKHAFVLPRVSRGVVEKHMAEQTDKFKKRGIELHVWDVEMRAKDFRRSTITIQKDLQRAIFRETSLKWFMCTPHTLSKRVWNHFLFQVLDKDALAIATSCNTTNVTIDHYNTVVRSLESAKEAHALNPSVTALWMNIMGSNYPCKGAIHQALKIHMKRNGLTNRGWKYLLKLSVLTVTHMVNTIKANVHVDLDMLRPQEGRRMPNQLYVELHEVIARTLNNLAMTDVSPRYTVMRWLSRELIDISMWAVQEDMISSKVSILRACFKATKYEAISNKRWNKLNNEALQNQTQLPPPRWSGRLHVVWDWMHQLNVPLARNQRNMDFIGMERLAAAWHQELRNNQIGGHDIFGYSSLREPKEWESAIESYEYEELVALPINSTVELMEEGKAMHHCVAGYDSYCVNGTTRIFSIQDKEGKRISTLELRYDAQSNRWNTGQNYGPCNHQVEHRITGFGTKVAAKYTEEFRKDEE